MNLNAAALRLMAAKGLTLEDVAEIVAANEVRADHTNAERQARFRAKKNGKSNGVTVTPVTPSPNDIYSNPQPIPLDISNEISPPISVSDKNGSSEKPILIPEHVLEVWNDTADRLGLPKARMTPQRRRALNARIRQHPIEDFTEAIAAIERSPFLRGENDRAWRADFDFFLQPKTFTKLIEGSYDHSTH